MNNTRKKKAQQKAMKNTENNMRKEH